MLRDSPRPGGRAQEILWDLHFCLRADGGSSAARARQQHKHHGRQQYQIQKQRVAAPDRHSGKKRRDGHKRQQHKQPARTRLTHGKIRVETCIQA